VKVSIIGASGRVGRAAAFCLAEENYLNELVLISRKRSIGKIEGEALDMYDALAAKGVEVSIKTSSDFDEIGDSDVVVLTSGIARKPGISRMDLGVANAKIVAKYSKKVSKFSPESIMLVVTNPVDIMTYVALKSSEFEKNRVFGIGNHLDSLRLKHLISKHFNIHVSEVHTRVIGEHGEHMVPLLSSTSIGGILLKYFSAFETFDINSIIGKVKNAGGEIISKKESTEYGPAFAISNIVTTILNDEKRMLTVTAYLDGEIEGIHDVCLGVPIKLGIHGVEWIIPIKMTENEKRDFINAAMIVKNNTHKIMSSLGKI